MASERAALAAARVRSARRRSAELRERIERLGAGEATTEQDVVAARAAAEYQRHEALRARERLALAHALAERVRRSRADTAWRGPVSAVVPAGASGTEGVARLRRERRYLRSALVAAVSATGEPLRGRLETVQRDLWEAMFDRCGEVGWQGWASALCVAAVELLPDLRGAAISGHDARHVPYLLGCSGSWSRRAEEVERVVGEGPASSAYRSGVPVTVPRVADEQTRWPGYAAAAAAAGVDGVLALPVQLNRVALASLTLFWRAGYDGVGGDGRVPLLLADLTTEVVRLDVGAIEDGLELGDAGGDRISLATGMLAEQLGVGVDEALDRMRGFAFGEARGLSDVAEAILGATLRLS